MDDRKYFILSAILRSYIESAEPIGSRTLQRDFSMDVSAATIRNEMSDLEHLGYLRKAHTSSGRIPSTKAYRWYVNELEQRHAMEAESLALSDRSLLKESNDLEHVLRVGMEILSDTTGYPAFSYILGGKSEVLKRLELIPLSPQELVMVFIFDLRVVRTVLVHLPEPYDTARVERTGEIFHEILEGRTLEEIQAFLEARFFNEGGKRSLIAALIPTIRKEIATRLHPPMRFYGLRKFYKLLDFAEEKITALLERLYEGAELESLLAEVPSREGVQTLIGEENPLEWMQDCSIVWVPLCNPRERGGIGVITPTRAPYRRVMNDVYHIGRYIESLMERTRRAQQSAEKGR